MKGLELAFNYYNEFGKPMLESQFSSVLDKIAVGLVGEGSECFGYDDLTSTDHDFDMGFCLFITKEDYKEIGFKLERAYANLPKEFLGYKRQNIMPVGGNRKGVMVIEVRMASAELSTVRQSFLPYYRTSRRFCQTRS